MLELPISVDEPEPEAVHAENSNARLKRARATLARYRVWHLAHTAPLPQGQLRNTMFTTDARALGDHLGTLMHYYEAAGLWGDFPQVIDRLESAIDSKEWSNCITYHRALWAWNRSTDNEACRAVLATIPHINELRDPQILSLYLNVAGNSLEIEQQRRIAATIARETEHPSWRLQYRALTGIYVFENGDRNSGLNEVRAALMEFEAGATRDRDWYGRLQHGNVLQFLGTETEDQRLLDAARIEFEALIAEASLAPRSHAAFLREIGRIAIAQKEYGRAHQALRESNDIVSNPLNLIHQAEAFLYSGDHSASKAALGEVDWDALDSDARFAFCSIHGHLALRMADPAMMNATSERLRDVAARTPRLREVRDQLRISLLEATHQTTTAAAGLAREKVAKLFDIASSLLRASDRHEVSTNVPTSQQGQDALADLLSKPQEAPRMAIDWKAISDSGFESLIFDLVADTRGYENPQWLMQTNAPDRARDISVTRVHDDALIGSLRQRMMLQCKHWMSKSVADTDIANALTKMAHWEPPAVDIMVVATTGRFTADAVRWVEQHNHQGKRPHIELWPDNAIERMLTRRASLVTKYGLGGAGPASRPNV